MPYSNTTNPKERSIYERYWEAGERKEAMKTEFVSVRPVIVADAPDAHQVWLDIGVQHFTVGDYLETKDEADWLANQLRIALANTRPSSRGEDDVPTIDLGLIAWRQIQEAIDAAHGRMPADIQQHYTLNYWVSDICDWLNNLHKDTAPGVVADLSKLQRYAANTNKHSLQHCIPSDTGDWVRYDELTAAIGRGDL